MTFILAVLTISQSITLMKLPSQRRLLVKFWLIFGSTAEFLTLKRGKMAKSEGNIVILDNLIKEGFNPLAYRYLCLTTHYRSKLSFSLPTLKGAQNALNNLYERVREIKSQSPISKSQSSSKSQYQNRFLEFISDDLDTPKALALMWEVVKDKKIKIKDKKALLLDFDKVLGLDLAKVKKPEVPRELLNLAKQRENYRQAGQWKSADEIRQKIKAMGWAVEDTEKGPKLKKL